MEKKKPEINIHNIKSFLEGNSRMLLANAGLQPKHIEEQIAYRIMICSDCMENDSCEYCGCAVPGKMYVKESCNKGERFPDLMCNLEWIKYKKENDIE